MSEPLVTSVLEQALAKYKSNSDLAEISSIFLGGRLLSYPWMREYLTKASAKNNEWNIKTGKPRHGNSNAYVNNLLYSDKLLESFSAALKKFDYRITGISCEKILVNKNKLPEDGMCWLNLK